MARSAVQKNADAPDMKNDEKLRVYGFDANFRYSSLPALQNGAK
jgi:hypothetical protein